MKGTRTLVGRGVIAGAAAAIALAVWFLAIDSLAGEPLRTPAFLAGVLLGIDAPERLLMVAVFTLIHFAAFIAIGVAMAWVVERLGMVPGALIGVVLGFLLFDLMFYGSVLVTGVPVVQQLGWPAVLAGNIIAGLVLLGALQLMGVSRPVSWGEMLAAHSTLREGLIAGLIGATAVAVWFLIIDLIGGRILFTPAALGSALFLGARSPAEVQVTLPIVTGYTLIHATAFAFVGLLAAVLVAKAEEVSEVILLGAILLFVTFEAFFIGMLAIMSNWLVETLALWRIAAANAIAAISMGAYLYLKHPALMHDLRYRDLEEDLAHDEDLRSARGAVRPHV